jgi:hypothetical protein
MSDLKALLVKFLTKDLILSLEDGLRAEALKAFEVIKNHTGLKDPRRARGAEGQVRFRMMEERFEEVCQDHGGKPLEGGVIPMTDLQVFQPFCRFEIDGQGIIFGLASMPEARAIPSKNKSRVAGVSINFRLSLSLFDGPKTNDIFVMLLVSRHRERAGQIEEIAIGVIDSKYESFLFYESLDVFLREMPADDAFVALESPRLQPPQVTLKKGVSRFVPPESLNENEVETDEESKTA